MVASIISPTAQLSSSPHNNCPITRLLATGGRADHDEDVHDDQDKMRMSKMTTMTTMKMSKMTTMRMSTMSTMTTMRMSSDNMKDTNNVALADAIVMRNP